MRKYLLSILLCFAIIGIGRAQKLISDVRRSGTWYRINNTTGKNIRIISSANGVLVGFCGEFILLKANGWYYLYDATGKRYKTLSASIGEVTAVSGATFTVKKGNWLHIYDKNGKRIRTCSM